MKVAILGASSKIAFDVILSLSSSADKSNYSLFLFTRKKEELIVKLDKRFKSESLFFFDYQEFTNHSYDCVINFIGVGDPYKTKRGSENDAWLPTGVVHAVDAVPLSIIEVNETT